MASSISSNAFLKVDVCSSIVGSESRTPSALKQMETSNWVKFLTFPNVVLNFYLEEKSNSTILALQNRNTMNRS